MIAFDDLCACIDYGYPVVCVTDPDRRDHDSHWLVVYGYRRRPAQVLVAGNGWMHVLGMSLAGEHVIARRRFERQSEGEVIVCWKETDARRRIVLSHRQPPQA